MEDIGPAAAVYRAGAAGDYLVGEVLTVDGGVTFANPGVNPGELVDP